jgi:glucosylceramidase
MEIYTTTQDKDWQTSANPTQNEIKPTTTLDFDGSTGQTWEGFGGCFNELCGKALDNLSGSEKGKILDDLFLPGADGLNFNFCRIPVGANDYAESWYSYDECDGDYEMNHFSIERDKKYIIPLIHEAQKRNPDIQFFASPWSPPAWMKYPKAYNYGTLVWTKKNLDAYARYLLKFTEAYENEGIHISQLHVQNEPVSSQKFPSCIWTGKQFAEFIGQYLGPLFKRCKPDTKIWLGTLNGPETDSRALYTRYNDYANLVLHDPDAYRYIEGISYQWAGKYAVDVTRESFPEKKLIQSENECGDGENTWEYAKYVYELFRNYLTGGVCAYVYWNLALPPKGTSTWGWSQNSLITIGPEIKYNHEYYVMKHFSEFIHPGAVRLGLKGHFTGTSAAFRNPDGQVVLVIQNPFEIPQTFDLRGKTVTLSPDSINTIVL